MKAHLLQKIADVPENLQQLDQPATKQQDALKRVLQWYRENKIDSLPWRDFQRFFQQICGQYPQMFTEIRKNRPVVTYDDLADYLVDGPQQEAPYGVSYDRYQDGASSFRDVEQLVLQINQGAAATEILAEDPLVAQYVSMVRQSSEMSGHPSNRDSTVGWLRVDFVNQDYLLVDEVQTDLVNSVTQAKSIVESRTFPEFMQRIQSEKIRDMIQERGIDADRFNQTRRQFIGSGYTVEKLDAIKNKLVDLFKDWAEYALSTLIEIARRHDIKYVAIHTAESIAQRDDAVDSSKVKIYYDHLAQAFGFKKQELNEGGLHGKFWVRKVSAMKAKMLTAARQYRPGESVDFKLFVYPVDYTREPGKYPNGYPLYPPLDATTFQATDVGQVKAVVEKMAAKWAGHDAQIAIGFIPGYDEYEDKHDGVPPMRGLRQYLRQSMAEGTRTLHKAWKLGTSY